MRGGRPQFAIRCWPFRWLDHRCLPHLVDWQRRVAVTHWRRGGGTVLVGLLLVGAPDGAALPAVASLVLVALAWAWWATVMRASAGTSEAAMHLLAAVPLSARCARAASFRYPLFAAACALVPMAAGAVLGGRIAIVPAWIACACMVSAWPLFRILRATRPPDSPA